MPDFMVNFSSTVSFVATGHDVSPMQYEYCPEGTGNCVQAAKHELNLTLVNLNLGGSYYFNNWIGVRLMLPIRIVISDAGFLDANDDIIEDFVSGHHRDETLFGPGDLSLAAITRHSGQFSSKLSWFVSTTLGITVPTGNVVDNPEIVGMWKDAHQHMFFGRGMPAPTLGLNASLRMDWGFVESSFSAIIPFLETGSKEYLPPEGREFHEMYDWDPYDSGQYLAPTTITGEAGVGSNFGTDDWTLTALTQVEHETQAKWQGFKSRNSGRTGIMTGVRSSLVMGNGLIAELSIKIPVYLHMPTENSQVEMPFMLGFGFYFMGDA
jgi:hypothetical protein